MNDDELEWKRSVFEDLVSDKYVQNMAWNIVESTTTEDDPPVSAIDMAGSRNYLKRCLMRMTVNELASIDRVTAAALWARGAIGSARWRAQRKPPPTTSAPARKKLRG